jgi:hypothetical protein
MKERIKFGVTIMLIVLGCFLAMEFIENWFVNDSKAKMEEISKDVKNYEKYNDSIFKITMKDLDVTIKIMELRRERIARDSGYACWNTFKASHPNYIVNYRNAYDSL